MFCQKVMLLLNFFKRDIWYEPSDAMMNESFIIYWSYAILNLKYLPCNHVIRHNSSWNFEMNNFLSYFSDIITMIGRLRNLKNGQSTKFKNKWTATTWKEAKWVKRCRAGVYARNGKVKRNKINNSVNCINTE